MVFEFALRWGHQRLSVQAAAGGEKEPGGPGPGGGGEVGAACLSPLPSLSAVSREKLPPNSPNSFVLTSGRMECLAINHFNRNFTCKAKTSEAVRCR